MNVRSAYETIGADYKGVLNRLMSEALVERFTGKFLDDPSFDKLRAAIEAGDVKEAFLAAHTLKGICQNLGFTNLFAPTSELTEALRDASEMADNAPALFEAVRAEYEKTVAAFQAE